MTLGIHDAGDKRTDIGGLVEHVADGDCVAIGGGLSSREPMAIIREILRRGRSNLVVVGSAHGIDIDLLCSDGAVSATEESYVGFEQDFGLAPNYRRACESGAVAVRDNACYTLVQQLRAAIAGLPFMPMRSMRGTSFESLHPDFKRMTCPFTGQELLLVPALAPDVAIIHAQYGDAQGNLRIEGPPVADGLFARASQVVIATVESLVSTDELHRLGGVTIPYFYVTAVAEAPMGAHPTACYPFYGYDRQHTAEYYAAASAGPDEFANGYLEPFVYGCATHDDYLESIGGPSRRELLASWDGGDQAWMRLYRQPEQ